MVCVSYKSSCAIELCVHIPSPFHAELIRGQGYEDLGVSENGSLLEGSRNKVPLIFGNSHFGPWRVTALKVLSHFAVGVSEDPVRTLSRTDDRSTR